MTNVPKDIRDAWAEIYTLFDICYCMDGSEKAWEEYWGKATNLIKKYGDRVPMVDMMSSVAHMIEFFVKQREQPKNESLPWKADEDYPYPKD
jgi:hypothetical protein